MSSAVIRFCCFLPPRVHLLDAAVERSGRASQKWRKAFFSKPMSTNIALRPCSIFLTRPLKMLPTMLRSRLALDGVFLELSIFEQGDAAFEFFAVDDEFVAGLLWRGRAYV